MAGFEVNITLDPDRFLAALEDWKIRVGEQTDYAVIEAAEFLKELVQENLARFPHPWAEATPAPEFIGPVGMISGALRDSVTIDFGVIVASGFQGLARGTAKVYPTEVYSRIQELGGWTGTDHMTFIPPRPYFRPMVEEVDTSGPTGIEHIFYDRWRQAQEAVTGLGG